MAIRRQLKADKQSVSLARLLKDIAASPTIVTREWFFSLYSDSVVPEAAIEKDFHSFAPVGAAHIDGQAVQADLVSLRSVGSVIESFADRLIAHDDARGVDTMPTYADLDAAIDLVYALTRKYYLMLHAGNIIDRTPTIGHNWQAVFDYPWRKSF